MELRAAACVIAMAVGSPPAAAAAPRWCSAGDLNASEVAICSSPLLGQLDDRLNEAYAEVRGFRDVDQETWIEDRNACGPDPACLEYSYRGRISELQAIMQMLDSAGGGGLDAPAAEDITVMPLPGPAADGSAAWSDPAPAGRRPSGAAVEDGETAFAEALGDPAAAALPMLDEMTPRPWCRAARINPTERTVCGDRNLSRLDALLELVYGRAKARDEDRAQLVWLRSDRDGCGTDVACIALAYGDRIKALNAPFARDAGRRLDVVVPAGHFPPPGWCRVWYPERPPTDQPPISACEVTPPEGSVLLRG